MAKINGTSVLLYADGTVIALQKGLNISADVDLPDASNKESAGWAEHIQGMRNATLSFDALYSTTGKSAAALLAYITGRSNILIAIVGGFSYPILGEVKMNSLSLTGNKEEPAALSGSLKVNGKLYQLKGSSAQLVTDPDATGTDYDTFTISGIAVTSAINLDGTAYAHSNTFSITSGDIVKVAVYVTNNSGAAPTVELCQSGGLAISNVEQLVNGLNIVTLTARDTQTAHLTFRNAVAANFALSNIYCFKDPN